MATDDEILLTSTIEIIELMKKTETMNVNEIKELAKKSPAIYYHNSVNKAARWSLGKIYLNILIYKK